MRIVLIAHYYPPINSSGAKRAESLSKYFTLLGHEVTVLTTRKDKADGEFTEKAPEGVQLIELDWAGRDSSSAEANGTFEPMYSRSRSGRRRFKDWVMSKLGQIPDPRLPFALAFLSPWFSKLAQKEIRRSDIVIGTTPPWPMLFAACICKYRFSKHCILDYRDHFSECHEMPGGPLAKKIEKMIDRRLARAADHVVCISEPMSEYYRQFTSRVQTILNGYDHELLDEVRSKIQTPRNKTVLIRYMGVVSPGRIPYNVLNSLIELKKKRPDLFSRLRFEFYGTASPIEDVLKTSHQEISSIFFFFPPVPYIESLKKIIQADYLLFSETSSTETLSARGILPTKLFEYVGSGRPIIGDISPEALAGRLLLQCNDQNVVGQSASLFLTMMMRSSFYERTPDLLSHLGASLSRQAQAKQYLDLIQKIILKH